MFCLNFVSPGESCWLTDHLDLGESLVSGKPGWTATDLTLVLPTGGQTDVLQDHGGGRGLVVHGQSSQQEDGVGRNV